MPLGPERGDVDNKPRSCLFALICGIVHSCCCTLRLPSIGIPSRAVEVQTWQGNTSNTRAVAHVGTLRAKAVMKYALPENVIHSDLLFADAKISNVLVVERKGISLTIHPAHIAVHLA